MEKLINAEKLVEYKASGVSELTEWQKGWNDAIDTIMSETPPVDAVEVVRCKDCIHSGQCTKEIIMRIRVGSNLYCPLGSDGFCSLGKRRKDA